MRAKMILALLFLTSLAVAVMVIVRALPPGSGAAAEPPSSAEILIASSRLAAGTLLRAPDVAWQTIIGVLQTGDVVRPSAAAREARPEIDEETRATVYGAALRHVIVAGDPIRAGDIAKAGDRDFLDVVLSPGARAVTIPVATGGTSIGLLSPGDRVDVILTQKFNDSAPLTRRSVSETVVENLRVLVIDVPEVKGNALGKSVTLEVTPDQAEKITVAAELGKLSLTLRGVGSSNDIVAASQGYIKPAGVRPTWAGDVSPALSGAVTPDKVLVPERPTVEIIRGSHGSETVKPQ